VPLLESWRRISSHTSLFKLGQPECRAPRQCDAQLCLCHSGKPGAGRAKLQRSRNDGPSRKETNKDEHRTAGQGCEYVERFTGSDVHCSYGTRFFHKECYKRWREKKDVSMRIVLQTATFGSLFERSTRFRRALVNNRSGPSGRSARRRQVPWWMHGQSLLRASPWPSPCVARHDQEQHPEIRHAVVVSLISFFGRRLQPPSSESKSKQAPFPSVSTFSASWLHDCYEFDLSPWLPPRWTG
jgi:hypothetical protein